MVEKHNGSLHVESELDKGVLFCIIFLALSGAAGSM
ncbi:ATP-binding protein [Paenibacillus assamensis]|nr:ATP-binding protein [Paenibacillus assamensis]